MSRRASEERGGGYSNMKEILAKEQVGAASTYLKLPKGIQLFKLKPGLMFIDIIPFIVGNNNPNADEGMRHWERTFWVHKGVGVDNEMFLCLAKSMGEKCPICEYRASLRSKAANDEDTFDLVKSLEPKERQLFNVIDTKSSNTNIQIWDISKHLFGKDLIKEIRNSDEQDHWDEFFYLENGFTLKIGVEERTFNGHSFPAVDTIHFKERAKDYPDTLLDEAPCLDDCFVIPTYEELKETFMQSAEGNRSKGGDRERGSERGGRGDDRGGDRRERRSEREEPPAREERGSRGGSEREPEREERSEHRSRDREDPPAREERSERRGRADREERPEEREPRGGRAEKDGKDKEPDKGGEDPWAERSSGKAGDKDREAEPERESRSERRGRREAPPAEEERPRVRSDEDNESRRERSGRRDEPDEPARERGGREREQPKDWNDLKEGERRGRDRGGEREERSERRGRR